MRRSSKNPASTIREFLNSKNFKPGDRIPTQAQLSTILGVSVRSLREGLNILVRQGMLAPRGRAGTFVASPKEHSVVEPIKWYFEANEVNEVDLITARAILEAAIVKEVCSRRTTKDLLLLQHWVEAQSEKGIPAEQEIEYDKKFHLQLISSAHNKVFEIVGNVILLQFELLYRRNLYPDQDIIRVRDHQQILDAVFERDAQQACRMTETHIMRSLKLRTPEVPAGKAAPGVG